ncbi:hypothetical protein RRG08_027670 [Elysia crispata]|uniref:Uncharacterized protein n=1 Tax=Elysia crispata TaxID=231223 RepID=A0AAE0XM21_9GAST|nr:hypothetical protein RRG08_027670 [Elysia crispata]
MSSSAVSTMAHEDRPNFIRRKLKPFLQTIFMSPDTENNDWVFRVLDLARVSGSLQKNLATAAATSIAFRLAWPRSPDKEKVIQHQCEDLSLDLVPLSETILTSCLWVAWVPVKPIGNHSSEINNGFYGRNMGPSVPVILKKYDGVRTHDEKSNILGHTLYFLTLSAP